jgi:hypothetical protein
LARRALAILTKAEFLDQVDAKWIVIRGHLRGHNITTLWPPYWPPRGWPPAGGFLVFLVTIN